MEPDRGLARAGASLHDERRARLAGDEPVLVRLDRRHDVAHAALARTIELLEQEVVDAGDGGLERAVERLVAHVEEPSALRSEPTTESYAVRIVRGCRVEGACRRRLPVDDERFRVVVVHPATPDIDGCIGPVDVDAAEAEPALGFGERLQAP